MQTKSSPVVARVVGVLNFFLEHPDHPFSLTQISKSLRLSRATTHLILLSFVEAGYLYRRTDKSYILGSMIPALTASAGQKVSTFPVGRDEMRALADDLDLVASALFIEEGEIVVRERIAAISHLGRPARMTVIRYSLYPANGAFLLPLSDREIRTKLAMALPPLSQQDLEMIWKQVAFGRKYGFVLTLEGPDRSFDPSVLSASMFVEDLAAGEFVSPWFLAAPVLSADRTVQFVITIHGLEGPTSSERIFAIGQRLKDGCDAIGRFYGR
ncbi:helix-turn-helix domain-containing protein [Novosphingobium sp. G106]|uniref:helix-turn-helix domain-containing protein n=1 Tax=Novosphingobium sp. G106 TaxID=2849500 RepID=UPI001C2DC861|nr:helix-turn-helix domain-containing protein [Novosphingobium sp. G106]MBV1686444.1 helix-turn-helix domain-containing protein [Novosphingobium sp. G106]